PVEVVDRRRCADRVNRPRATMAKPARGPMHNLLHLSNGPLDKSGSDSRPLTTLSGSMGNGSDGALRSPDKKRQRHGTEEGRPVVVPRMEVIGTSVEHRARTSTATGSL